MLTCKYCRGVCIKKGWYKTIQKYRCLECGKYQRNRYSTNRYTLDTEHQVYVLNKECVGISSMSRILKIPKSSAQMLILRAASRVTKPVFITSKQSFEVDESIHLSVVKRQDVILYMQLTEEQGGCSTLLWVREINIE